MTRKEAEAIERAIGKAAEKILYEVEVILKMTHYDRSMAINHVKTAARDELRSAVTDT